MLSLSSLSPPSSLTLHCNHTKLFFHSTFHRSRIDSRNFTGYTIRCRLTKTREASSNTNTLSKEPHKYFDQVIITVRAGDGGHGTILGMTNDSRAKNSREKTTRWKSSYKRDFDGSLILPVGGHGGDVVIYADEGKDTLLDFHEKSRYNAKRGGNVDAMGVLSSQSRDGLAAPTLRIAVPVGTAVKHKRGKLLADLVQPGEEVLVARGGQGGV